MAFSVGRNYDLGLVPNSYVATPVSETLNTLTTYDSGSDLRFTTIDSSILALEQENSLLKERVSVLELSHTDMKQRLQLLEQWISKMN